MCIYIYTYTYMFGSLEGSERWGYTAPRQAERILTSGNNDNDNNNVVYVYIYIYTYIYIYIYIYNCACTYTPIHVSSYLPLLLSLLIYLSVYLSVCLQHGVTSGVSRETCAKHSASAVGCDLVLHRAFRTRRPPNKRKRRSRNISEVCFEDTPSPHEN